MNWTDLEPILDRLADVHLYPLFEKLRGWGIQKDEDGWYFCVYTINTDCPEIPSIWEGIRVKQQVRPETFLANKNRRTT